MATISQITQVRLNINDEDKTEFNDAQIEAYIDDGDSVNYASWKLINILVMRLRKETLKKDTTGAESTEFQSLNDRRKLLESLAGEYKAAYKSETGYNTGRFISSTRPDIAGGDI